MLKIKAQMNTWGMAEETDDRVKGKILQKKEHSQKSKWKKWLRVCTTEMANPLIFVFLPALI